MPDFPGCIGRCCVALFSPVFVELDQSEQVQLGCCCISDGKYNFDSGIFTFFFSLLLFSISSIHRRKNRLFRT